MEETAIIENAMKFTSLASSQGSSGSSGLFGKRFLGGIISGVISLFSGAFGSSGSKSKYYKEMMEEQRISKTITTSTRYNEHIYTVQLSTKCKLHTHFKNWILDLADAVEFSGNDEAKPRYYSQLFLKEFGTHFVRRAHVGAKLYQVELKNSSLYYT